MQCFTLKNSLSEARNMIWRLPEKENKIEEFREAFLQNVVFFKDFFKKLCFFEKVLKFREKKCNLPIIVTNIKSQAIIGFKQL